MANAACTCVVEQTGTSTSMTSEATTLSGGNTVAQITDASKRVLDPDTAITVTDNGSPVADDAYTVNYLFGKVTKGSGSFTGPVTITANYLPRHSEAEVTGFEVNVSAELPESTTMSATTSAKSRTLALADAQGSIQGLDNLRTDLDAGGTTIVPFTDFTAGTRRVLSITFPGGEIFRAFVRFNEVGENMEVSDLLRATLSWVATAATGTDQTEGQAFAWSNQ